MRELKELIDVFTNINDKKIMSKFFEEIFTEAERKDFASRWGLMKDLKAGVSQRSIAANRHISLCKITRGSKLIQNPKSVASKMIEKYSK